jgi:hypothetical protein
LEAQLKIKLEAFAVGRDQGIDFRYLDGPNKVIIQAKHYVGSGFPGLLRAMVLEREKALRLAPTRYVLVTSISLTAHNKDELRSAMSDVPLALADILGKDDLNHMLRNYPQIEKSHFKLWLSSVAVLERILLSGVYNRTSAEMDIIREMVPRFVQNQSVTDAIEKLDQSGALIVAGAPGVGKTTLARMLMWLHAEQGWNVFVVDDLESAFKVADPTEKRIIFLDDFLGQVRLSADHVRGVDARLPPLIARVAAHENLRFVLTTRDYILAQARLMSSRLAPSKINAREYVLNVGQYTRGVKARILYNHIFFSALTHMQRDELLKDDFYVKIIDHKNFNPRLIEEVTSQEFLALTNRPIRETIEASFDTPQLLWERPFRQHINKEAQLLMLALFINGRFAKVEALKASFMRVARAMGHQMHISDLETRFRSAFKTLDGSVLSLMHDFVNFVNPGLRDFLQSVVAQDQLVPVLLGEVATCRELRELMEIFHATKPSKVEIDDLTPAWVAAFDRMTAAGLHSRYEYLEIAADLASYHTSDVLEARIASGLVDFEIEPIELEEVSEACSLLEKSQMTNFSWELEERFRNVATSAVAEFLSQNSLSLSLEDIQSLDETLHTYGANKALAAQVSFDALDAIAQNIDSEIRNIESIDELDEFEANIVGLMERRNFSPENVVRNINWRRNDLSDEGRYERRQTFATSGNTAPSKPMADAEMKSMFDSLKSL